MDLNIIYYTTDPIKPNDINKIIVEQKKILYITNPKFIHLDFKSDYFNQPLVNIPHDIYTITVHRNFNQSFNTIPTSVNRLIIYSEHQLPYSTIPESIEIMYISLTYVDFPINNLPTSIQEIKILSLVNDEIKKNNLIKIPFGCKIIANNEDFL